MVAITAFAERLLNIFRFIPMNAVIVELLAFS
jgi:hypothetical protein